MSEEPPVVVEMLSRQLQEKMQRLETARAERE